MRAITTKRRMGEDGARIVAKRARAERLAFRLLEKRARWIARQSRTTAAMGGV
jgi:hypothetical protein